MVQISKKRQILEESEFFTTIETGGGLADPISAGKASKRCRIGKAAKAGTDKCRERNNQNHIRHHKTRMSHGPVSEISLGLAKTLLD